MRVMPLEIEHPERIGLLLDFGNCRKQKTNSIVQGLPWGVRLGSTPWKFLEMRKSSGVLSQTDSGSGGYRKARPRECEQNIVLEKTAAEQNVRKSWGAPGWATKICDIPERVGGLRSFQRNSRIFRMNVFSE